MHLTWSPFLLTLLLTSATTTALRKPSNSVLLSKIQTLTLRQNAKTTARRVTAIPQLTCTGPACSHYSVDVMRCKNAGSDYDDGNVQWTCTASLPAEFKLGSTDVQCEGFDSPDDPYILKGSCGVTYRLLLTDLGREKYGDESWFGGGGGNQGGLAGVLFISLFIAVAAWIVWGIVKAWRAQAVGGGRRAGGRNAGFGGWGGGGGGGGGNDDPPPPYYPRAPKPSTDGQQQEGWRPGFWTGAIGGAAASYLAANRNRGYQEDTFGRGQRGGGGWFGNNNDNGGGWGAGPSRPATRSSSSSSNSFGSARHESTGFGSTSRR